MKKAFDQTVRDIKREVNKKVLKVPGIEQKVLDATSNEPWGPHGSLLADIAQATRNYHEYQMIMAVIWKRINDTGKNWRHVYKGLTVLEYLVAHGSERVIDEIREHAYQISTLSDFQYIDSSGRDQGNNVRKKSQSLVVLVNDKERIQEVRQKAAANRDKFRNTSMGGMYRPGSYSSTGGYGDRYDDDRYEGRYGSRDDDRDGYGREREWGSRDDDRYGRHGDSYGRDRDRYGRDSDEGYGRDGYREDDYSGRSRNIDEYQYGSRSRSSDRERDHANEDDGQYSSRGGGARADDHSQDARGSAARADDQIQDGSFPASQLDRKLSEQSLGVPPSYEDVVGEARSPVDSGRNRDTVAVSVPHASIPYTSASPNQATATPGMPAALSPAAPVNKEVDGFDEFDPRGSFSAAQTTSSAAEVDLLGSLSESFSSSPLAIVPVTATTTASGDDASANFNSAPSFSVAQSASTVTNQPFEDPFGDGPFRALPSTDGVSAPPQNIAPTTSFHPSANQSSELPQSVPGIAYTPSSNLDPQLPNANAQFSPQEPLSSNQDTDILAGILPPAAPPPPLTLQTGFPLQASQPTSVTGFSTPAGQPATARDFPAQASQPAPQTGFPSQASNPTAQPVFPAQTGQHQLPTGFPAQVVQPTSQPGFVAQTAQPASLTSFPAQTAQSVAGFPGQFASASQTGFPAPSLQPAQPSGNIYGNFLQQGSTAPAAPNVASQTTSGPTPQFNTTTFLPHSGPAGGLAGQHNNNLPSNALPQAQQTAMVTQSAVPSSAGSLAIVPQPAKDKFEPKSAVWADTLSRGLVNFNISGSKINPLADIGIDFDAINRKEKRMEKPTTAAVTSTVTMGKAMGSGSGIGRAGASVIRAPPNPTLGMGMGMGMGGGAVMGMGAYGGVNQPMGAGMGMHIPMNMGMGMNIGMGQGAQMQPAGFPPGSNVPGGYNPMIGRGGYPPQQPYGSGYR